MRIQRMKYVLLRVGLHQCLKALRALLKKMRVGQFLSPHLALRLKVGVGVKNRLFSPILFHLMKGLGRCLSQCLSPLFQMVVVEVGCSLSLILRYL